MNVATTVDRLKTSTPYLLTKRFYQDSSFFWRMLTDRTVYWESRRHPKIFFLHIPKTGGTSMRLVLESAYDGRIAYYYHNEYTPVERRFQQEKIRQNISSFDMVNGHFPFGLHRTLGICGQHITFLREPIPRFISDYHHRHMSADLPKDWDFERYLKDCPYLDNQMVRLLSGYGGHLSDRMMQVAFREAKRNLQKHFSFVGFLETLQQDWQRLRGFLGIELDELAYANKSKVPSHLTIHFSELPSNIQQQVIDLNYYDQALYDFALEHFH